MDSKNDDSAGSDSLDKSLQKKCVVDDVGQGEGVPKECSDSAEKTSNEDLVQHEENSTTNYKTEKQVGDCGGGGSGNDNDGGGPLNTAKGVLENVNAQEPLDTPACSDYSANANASASTSQSTTINNNNNAFETKVKQISKNLKETTLAETENKKTALEDSTSSSSSTSSDYEQAAPSGSTQCNSGSQMPGMETSALGSNESTDEHDHRSKKVRFHPDVKENDGGNPVKPKKKRKLKGPPSSDEGACPRLSSADDEMDLDEEEEADVEEEEEFDFAETMFQAENYLKMRPLTFVQHHDKSEPCLELSGLMEQEDVPESMFSVKEEDASEQSIPENGIERILGKQSKCGKVEFLLRYADRPDIGWESEEFVLKNCPNKLHFYELNRDRRQERLMDHVAKRQIIRQLYTDF